MFIECDWSKWYILFLSPSVNEFCKFKTPVYVAPVPGFKWTPDKDAEAEKAFFFLKKAISSVSTVGAHSEASSAPNQKQGLVKSEELKEAYLAKTKKQKAG